MKRCVHICGGSRIRRRIRMKRLIRFHQPICVYGHRQLGVSEKTIEHIVPVSALSSWGQKNDPMNMYVASSRINNFRSNYRFSEQLRDMDTRKVQEYQGSLRLLSRRLFYPSQGHRLIAHIVWDMLEKYDTLDETLIFDDPLTFQCWQRHPWTPREKAMLERQKELIRYQKYKSSQ